MPLLSLKDGGSQSPHFLPLRNLLALGHNSVKRSGDKLAAQPSAEASCAGCNAGDFKVRCAGPPSRLRNTGGSPLLAVGLSLELPGVEQIQHFFSEGFDSGGIADPGEARDAEFPSMFRLTNSLGRVPKIRLELAVAPFADGSEFGNDKRMIETGRDRRAALARMAQAALPAIRSARPVEDALGALEQSPAKDPTTLHRMRTNLRQNGLAWFQARLEAAVKWK